MDGGFESIGTSLNTFTTVAASTQILTWAGGQATSSVPAIYTTLYRTGLKSLQWTTGSTSNILFSPSAASTSVQNATSYVVQFYWYKAFSGSARSMNISAGSGGTSNIGAAVSSGTLGASAVSTSWTKATVVVTTGTETTTPRYGLIQIKPSGGSFATSGYLFDDFVVYPGSTVDNTAPDSPTGSNISSPSSSSLTVNWSAPSTGIDGGGYVVLRYSSDPAGQSDPQVNGIYNTGASIGAGTVVYIGTNTSFTDNGLAANTTYFYRVYSVDKAFNYCAVPEVVAGYTSTSFSPAATLATPNTVAAGTINQGATDAVLYRFSLQVTSAFVQLSGVSFPNSGTYASGDITNFKLYSSSTNTFPGGSPLATISAPSNASPQSFTGFNKYISVGVTQYFWITADVGATAVPGRTVQVTPALGSSNLTFSGTVPTVTVSSPAAAGIQTIQYSTAPTDYFRSVATGNWSGASNWESSHDNSVWATANAAPTASATLVTIRSAHIITADVTLTTPNIVINSGAELTIASAVLTPGSGKSITVNGRITVTATTKVLVTTSTNLLFNAGSVFYFNANGGYMPAATWDATSTAYITGWTSATAFTADNGSAANASNLVGQPATRWGHLIFDLPGLTGSPKVLTGFAANTNLTINGDFTILRTNGRQTQILTSSGASGLTCQNFYQGCGNWLINNASFTVTVNQNVRIADTLSAAPGYSIAVLSMGTTASNLLDIKGNMIHTIGTIMSAAASQVIQFSGGSSVTARFNSLSGLNLTVRVAPGKTVTLLSNMNNLGYLIVQDNTAMLKLNGYNMQLLSGISGTGYVSGGGTSAIQFQSATVAFGTLYMDQTTPGTTNALQSMTLNLSGASALVTLGSSVYITSALTLTAGTCQIGAGASLELASAGLTATSGFLAGTSTSDLIVSGTNATTITLPLPASTAITLRNLTLSGNRKLSLSGAVGNNISLYGAMSIGTSATFDNGGEGQVLNGGGAATMSIDGRFITRDGQGFTGASAAVASITPVCNTGSTIEYAGAAQDITNGNTYYHLNFSGAGLKTAPAGTLVVKGDLTKGASTTFNHNNGIVELSGGAQSFAGFPYNSLKLENNGTKTLTAAASVADVLTLGNSGSGTYGILNTGGFNFSFLSTATKTARLAPITGSSSITGNCIVQRYIPARRAWRLLGVPFSSSSTITISDAWRENSVGYDFSTSAAAAASSAIDTVSAGFGTLISGGTTTNGFDLSNNNSSSIKYFNAGSWVTPANLNSTQLASKEGWMVFVRGDRKNFGAISSAYVTPTNTTLRAKGPIKIGSKTISGSGITVVSNPYPSAIDYNSITRSGSGWPANPTYYLWDPTLGGLTGTGAFVTLTWNGSVFLTSLGSVIDNRYIPSGAAFMVDFPAGGSLTINETDKATTQTTVAFRGADVPKQQLLYTELQSFNSDLSPFVADGTLQILNDQESNIVNQEDARKFTNFSENLAILNNGNFLSMERRKPFAAVDSILFFTNRMQQKKYQLVLKTASVSFEPGTVGLLYDKMKNRPQLFDVRQNISYPFEVTSNSLSAATDRLKVYFRPICVLGSLTGQSNNRETRLQIQCTSYQGTLTRLELQQSENGAEFETIQVVPVAEVDQKQGMIQFNTIAETGRYSYRVKAIGFKNFEVLSNEWKKAVAPVKSGFTVSPNPVLNGHIRILLQHPQMGRHQYDIQDMTGLSRSSGSFSLNGGQMVVQLPVPAGITPGIYRLKMLQPDQTEVVLSVLIQ